MPFIITSIFKILFLKDIMFKKSKKTIPDLDLKQQELFEHAQLRIKEKQNLYTHFIFYLVGCIFFIVLNVFLNFGSEFKLFDLDWFVYAVLIWSFIMLTHSFKVLLFSKFMGKEWKAKQMAYLINKQKDQISEMEKKLNLKVPKEAHFEKNILLDNTQNKD